MASITGIQYALPGRGFLCTTGASEYALPGRTFSSEQLSFGHLYMPLSSVPGTFQSYWIVRRAP